MHATLCFERPTPHAMQAAVVALPAMPTGQVMDVLLQWIYLQRAEFSPAAGAAGEGEEQAELW